MSDYRLSHQAPGPEEDGSTVRLDRIGGEHDEVFPRDVEQHPQRYGLLHQQTLDALQRARGNPDAEVTVWRAVPAGVHQINPGDWVALSREYAQSESLVEGGQVISATAKASELWSEGLLEEWGYAGTTALVSKDSGMTRDLRKASFPQKASEAVSVESAVQARKGGASVGVGVQRSW